MAGAFIGALVSGWQARRLRLRIERGPRITDGQRLALAFAGGFVAAYGAKIAKGCISGQALTGGAAFLLFAAWGMPRIEARYADWRPAP